MKKIKEIVNENEYVLPKWMRITSDGRTLIQTNKMAEWLNVSQRQLQTWGKAGAPREERGWWDIKAMLIWRGVASTQGESNGLADKLNADVKLKQLKAQNEELKYKELTGELIPLSFVEERVSKVFAATRISFMGMGNRIMSKIFTLYPELAVECKRMIEIEVRETCKEISETGLFQRPAKKKMVGRPRRRSK
jgi:phage terminase Nu1 subunit (DNA packaging protein)